MADTKQFLDYTGLTSYDELIKSLIDNGDEVSIKVVALSSDGASIEFYTQTPGTGVSPAYSIEFPVADVSGLMSLVSGAVRNDIAIFDTNGQVVDSGTLLSDLATVAYVGEIPSGSNATTIAGYAKELADSVSSDVEEVKEELTEAIATAVSNAGHLKREIVTTLPSVSSADELTIYLIAKTTSGESNAYDEYMVINGAWEKIGDTEVDLSDYAKTEYVDSVASSTLSDAKDYADGLASNYDAAGTAQTLVSTLENGQVATNTSNISSIEASITNLETTIQNIETTVSDIEAIPVEDVEALFN